jgi:LPS sulfotransferase NodH
MPSPIHDRPIFVAGYQRSGTTLLQSLLGAHPRIAAPPETYFVFRIVLLADRYGDLTDDDRLKLVVHDALHPPADLLGDSGFDERRVFERVVASGERSMRGVFDALMRDFAERQGKARWSDKSPGQRAEASLRLFPEAQIIHIIRDPRDVIASSLATPWTKADAYQLAREWRRFTLDNIRTGRAAGPGAFLQIRYEDLAADPRAALRIVFSFLDEDNDTSVIENVAGKRPSVGKNAAPWQSRVLEAIEPAPSNAWRQRLSARDRQAVNAIVYRELEALGYEGAGRRDRVAGTIVTLPRNLKEHVRKRRLARAALDPQARERAVRAFLEEQADIIAAHTQPQST